MKVFVCFGMMIVMLAIWVEVGTAQTITATDMPDANLRDAVLAQLKATTPPIIVDSTATTFTRANLRDSGFTTLFANNRGIKNIKGLEHAINLTRLYLTDQEIMDISAVSGLINLIDLRLSNNNISHISAVSKLTSLEELRLSNNNISHISALSGLTTSLRNLYLNNNNISDISVVSKLTPLRNLSLSGNRIHNISALSGLTSLRDLALEHNRISDISAVENLNALETLRLNRNRIRSTEALLGLTNLQFLSIIRNRIEDIAEFQALSPLIVNHSLRTVRLSSFGDSRDSVNRRVAVENNDEAALRSYLWTRPGDIPPDAAVRSRGYSGDPPTTDFRFPITFSEPVFGFEMEDTTVETELETGTGDAVLEALSPSLPPGRLAQSYTLTIRLPANAAGTIQITLHARAAETDAGARTPAEDIVYDPIPFSTLPVVPETPPKRKIIFQCPVGWVRSDGFAGRTRRVLIYEVNVEIDMSNRVSIYKPIWVAIYVHPDEGLENLDGWKLKVALPYNYHRDYLLTAENSVVVDANIEGVEGGFAVIENPEETPFPMTGIGFTGALVPGFDYRLYDDTGRKVDFGISCYKRVDIFQVLKDMEDPRVLRKVLLGTLDWDSPYIRTEWTVPVPVNVPGSPSLPRVNLVGKWADLKKQ